VTKLLAKMPIQEIEPEPSYIEAKVVVLIVMVVAGLGLAGGYIIFPLLQVQATEPVITVDNLTNNTTESHTPTSTHTKKYTNNTTKTVQKAVQNTTTSQSTNTRNKNRNSSSN
jgi:hypothetical protein